MIWKRGRGLKGIEGHEKVAVGKTEATAGRALARLGKFLRSFGYSLEEPKSCLRFLSGWLVNILLAVLVLLPLDRAIKLLEPSILLYCFYNWRTYQQDMAEDISRHNTS